MIHNFLVCLCHIKVESVRCLAALDGPKEGLTEAGILDHTVDRVSSEEGVELCDGAVECLRRCPAPQLHVQLLRDLTAWVLDERFESLPVERSVLDRGIGVPERIRGRDNIN